MVKGLTGIQIINRYAPDIDVTLIEDLVDEMEMPHLFKKILMSYAEQTQDTVQRFADIYREVLYRYDEGLDLGASQRMSHHGDLDG